MDIKNLKDLKKLIQLCRTTGVEAIELGTLKMNLGPTPVIYKQYKTKPIEVTTQTTLGEIDENVKIPTDQLTEEQLLMWSAQSNEQ